MSMDLDLMTVMKTAAVLVLDQSYRALTLVTTTYGGITLPGGKMEPEDPTIEHAAIHELQEETGLIGEIGAFKLIHKQSVQFRLRDGSMGSMREVHLLHAVRVSGHARCTMSDRPIEWLDYTQLIARAPAFYADFYKAALPPGSGFAWLKPTEGI